MPLSRHGFRLKTRRIVLVLFYAIIIDMVKSIGNRIKVVVFLWSFLLASGSVPAQNPIPNPGFESWSSNEPQGWNTINQNILGTVFNPVTRDMVNPQEGLSSVKLETITKDIIFVGPVTMPGILTLGEIIIDIQNMTGTIEGGIPVSGFPTSLKGWFRYLPVQDDSGIIGLGLTRWNGQTRDTIAYGYLTPSGQNPEWQQFTLPVTYLLPHEPDTMNLLFVSSNLMNGTFITGSKLWLDNLWIEFGSVSVEIPEEENAVTMAAAEGGKSLMVSTAGNSGELKILNIFGALVFSTTVQRTPDHLKISLPQLPPGIYIARLNSSMGKSFVQKFMVNP